MSCILVVGVVAVLTVCPPSLATVPLAPPLNAARRCVRPIEDPATTKVIASHGKTGAQMDLQYTDTKVIGNGSFGVVFAARLLHCPKEEEEIAIKKVLQDKRFKVCTPCSVMLRR